MGPVLAWRCGLLCKSGKERVKQQGAGRDTCLSLQQRLFLTQVHVQRFEKQHTHIPVFSPQGITFTLLFLLNTSTHTTQDKGVRLSLYTRIKNCPISNPAKPGLIFDAYFYHLSVPIYAISSHKSFRYHLQLILAVYWSMQNYRHT